MPTKPTKPWVTGQALAGLTRDRGTVLGAKNGLHINKVQQIYFVHVYDLQNSGLVKTLQSKVMLRPCLRHRVTDTVISASMVHRITTFTRRSSMLHWPQNGQSRKKTTIYVRSPGHRLIHRMSLHMLHSRNWKMRHHKHQGTFPKFHEPEPQCKTSRMKN